MIPPEVAFQRFLYDRRARGENKYAHILGRIAVEELSPSQLYRWFSDWMNRQLSDIGVSSTGGVSLPPLHFEMVRVQNKKPCAHVFETGDYGFILIIHPIVDEMLNLSRRAVKKNWAFMTLQIAPSANDEQIAQLLLLIQFSFVNSHEYSHLVRQHLADHPPDALALGESLRQVQEFDADGYAIFHGLTYFFHGGGRQIAADLLRISSQNVLENSLIECFLLSTMLQFCARWAGKIKIESDLSTEHPPPPMRIQQAILFMEMWCREVGQMPTPWMTDGTLRRHFDMADSLFAPAMKAGWSQQIAWLKSKDSEDYRDSIRRGIDRLRTGKD